MAEKPDRVAQVRERITRIADADTRTARHLSRFAEYSREELALMLRFPPAAFPMHGFETKAACRIAWYGTFPKKDWPAALQLSSERVGYVMRKSKDDDGRGINLNVLAINIPAAISAPAAQEVQVFRRTKKGNLRRVVDVNVSAGALPPADDDEGAE